MLLWTDQLDEARSALVDLEKRCRDGGDEGSLAVMLFLQRRPAGLFAAKGRNAEA